VPPASLSHTPTVSRDRVRGIPDGPRAGIDQAAGPVVRRYRKSRDNDQLEADRTHSVSEGRSIRGLHVQSNRSGSLSSMNFSQHHRSQFRTTHTAGMGSSITVLVLVALALTSTPPEMPGTPQYFGLGTSMGTSPNIITYFKFSTAEFAKMCQFDI